MYFGYNTNGFAHHRLEDTLRILADLGYRGVALTLDWNALNPFGPELAREVVMIRQLLEDLNLRPVVETGARFLLDPWHKHQPTLLSRDQQDQRRRLDFLRRAVVVAQDLGANVVSFWSGAALEREPDSILLCRLATACEVLCDFAEPRGVRLAFEPEPGMFIFCLGSFADLLALVGRRPGFGLTIDIGHLHCQGEVPIADHLRRWRDLLWNVHIEDMRRGVHDHLLFGEGEIDFGPVLATLREIDYHGGVHVELSRHSHDAVAAARRAFTFLTGGEPSRART
jgi:sugar phosphate isomerase/epimerase